MSGLLTRPDVRVSPVGPFFRLLILTLPFGLLLMATLRQTDGNKTTLWLGTVFQALACCLALLGRESWRQPIGPQIITVYLIGLSWLWFGAAAEDWFVQLAKAILLLVPIIIFGVQMLVESGAPAIRQARILAHRLAHRQEWPSDLVSCRSLPEVKALRAALAIDAAPALALLDHPRDEVRVATLAALEFRKDWRPGQAELVLQLAQRAEQPAIRAAAVAALGNIDDRLLVETLAQFLHDPAVEVRKVAIEALLWDTEHRWTWIRFAVRRYLADPLFSNDGPLDQRFTPEAVKDLTGWSAEKGVLSARAAQSLGAHYHHVLSEQADDKVIHELRDLLADPHTPAVLRLELGKLLQHSQELNAPLLETMLDPSNPAPLRLIASETLLTKEGDGPLYAAAVAALRDLARLPNREIALSTADVIQRRLGVDLGLGLGQPLPPLHSRQAADITRRVMAWAATHGNNNIDDVESSQPVTQFTV